MAEPTTHPRPVLQSVGAVLLGFVAVVVLSLGTDQVLHVIEVYPPWGQAMHDPGLNLLALTYRCVYGVVGSYIAARLAPRNSMRHALVLGVIGFALSLAGAIATIPMDLGPAWYLLALVVTALPCAWIGRSSIPKQGGRTMSTAGLSKARLGRMHDVMAGYVERGEVPGIVTLVSRRGEVHVDAIGIKAVGGSDPMRRDTIFRIASMTKPITAVATMVLVEECKLRLDEPVDQLLPELANRKVLKRLDGPLDDTVPANRPITVRDLLTFRLGFGAVMEPPGRYPIQKAMAEAGLAPGPNLPSHSPDELMKRFGSLPLLHQPGEKWMYHSGSDILGVLIARASGQKLETFFRERVFEPLGMKDTGFNLPEAKLDRLATSYQPDPATSNLVVFDGARGGRWASPPIFESGGGGLASTVGDYLAFCRMMLGKGKGGGERILSRLSVELMTTDHITPNRRRSPPSFPASGTTAAGVSDCP